MIYIDRVGAQMVIPLYFFEEVGKSHFDGKLLFSHPNLKGIKSEFAVSQ